MVQHVQNHNCVDLILIGDLNNSCHPVQCNCASGAFQYKGRGTPDIKSVGGCVTVSAIPTSSMIGTATATAIAIAATTAVLYGP